MVYVRCHMYMACVGRCVWYMCGVVMCGMFVMYSVLVICVLCILCGIFIMCVVCTVCSPCVCVYRCVIC